MAPNMLAHIFGSCSRGVPAEAPVVFDRAFYELPHKDDSSADYRDLSPTSQYPCQEFRTPAVSKLSQTDQGSLSANTQSVVNNTYQLAS